MTANIFKGDVYISFPENSGWAPTTVTIVGINFISQLKEENGCPLKRHQSLNTHHDSKSFPPIHPHTVQLYHVWIFCGFTVFIFIFLSSFLFLAANSNNSVSGLLWCLARLTKPTLKDSGRDNHSTSAASFCDLWSCCLLNHYSKETPCCLALYSVSVYIYTVTVSTADSDTIAVGMSVLSHYH